MVHQNHRKKDMETDQDWRRDQGLTKDKDQALMKDKDHWKKREEASLGVRRGKERVHQKKGDTLEDNLEEEIHLLLQAQTVEEGFGRVAGH